MSTFLSTTSRVEDLKTAMIRPCDSGKPVQGQILVQERMANARTKYERYIVEPGR